MSQPNQQRTAVIIVGTVVAASVVAAGAALATFTALDRADDSDVAALPAATLPEPAPPRTEPLPPTTEPADDANEPGGEPDPEPPTIDPAVADRLSSFTTWETPTAVSVDDRSGSVSSGPQVADDRRSETVCRPQGLPPMSAVFTEFPVGAFSGSALPGLIIEGAGVEQGDLRVLPLERAPLRLSSTVDSASNVESIDVPESAAIQQAVTALKRDADVRLSADGVDVVASDITFVKSETHSFEEATLDLGISLHYESMTRSAGFEGSFELDEAVERHSIVVRLVQPMFQIRMELDGSETPASFFSPSVTEADLDALHARDRIGEDNPPVVIDAVTYGRVMYYTLTSSEVQSASELTAIVDGSYGGIDGEASLTQTQREVLARSEVQLIAYGGDQSQALEAIKSGDLGQYFGPANTTTAAPLTMTMRTLDGRSIDVADEATLQRIVCDVTPRPHEFRVAVSSIDNGTVTVTTASGGRIGSASEGSFADGVNNILATIPADLLEPGWNPITFSFTASGPGCSNIFDAEEFEASIRSRPTAGSGSWGTRDGRISFDENECGTKTFERWINTNTGAISAETPPDA